MEDPAGLIFNLQPQTGMVTRAIDIHEGEKVNEVALKELIRAAVALNLEGKSKAKSGQGSKKRPDLAGRGKEKLRHLLPDCVDTNTSKINQHTKGSKSTVSL